MPLPPFTLSLVGAWQPPLEPAVLMGYYEASNLERVLDLCAWRNEPLVACKQCGVVIDCGVAVAHRQLVSETRYSELGVLFNRQLPVVRTMGCSAAQHASMCTWIVGKCYLVCELQQQI